MLFQALYAEERIITTGDSGQMLLGLKEALKMYEGSLRTRNSLIDVL